MITVVCYLPLSNLNQPLIPWYNPFGDKFQLQIVDVHPYYPWMNGSAQYSVWHKLQVPGGHISVRVKLIAKYLISCQINVLWFYNFWRMLQLPKYLMKTDTFRNWSIRNYYFLSLCLESSDWIWVKILSKFNILSSISYFIFSSYFFYKLWLEKNIFIGAWGSTRKGKKDLHYNFILVVSCAK